MTNVILAFVNAAGIGYNVDHGNYGLATFNFCAYLACILAANK